MAKSGTVPFYNEVGTKSLRFDEGSSTSLARTPAADGNRRTWTWSAWFKRDQLSSNTQMLFSTSQNAPDEFNILILDGDDRMAVGTAAGSLILTSMKFRDFSAWYHVVARMDTTQGTAVNRFKLYINGVETANDTNGVASIISSQDQELGINKAASHHIGKRQNDSKYFGGYMSDINFVDGTSLGPDSFGEFKNGIWIPIVPDVTYGQNGFRLDFLDNAVDAPTSEGTEDTDNIGSDSSGEHNNWTSVNIVASDCAILDTPENNFCTLDSLYKQSSSTLSEGNLKAVLTSGGNSARTPSTFAVNSGKWYWEVRQSSANRFGMGVFDTDKYVMTNEDAGSDAHEWTFVTDGGDSGTGIAGNNSVRPDYGVEVANGEVIMVALDADNDAIWFGKENSWFNTDGSSDSAAVKAEIEGGTTTNAAHTGVTGNLTPVFIRQTSNDTLIVNFGQDSSFVGTETAAGNTDSNDVGDFHYAPPSGYLALCTANLPEPTIGPNSTSQATDYFNTVIYTGSASSPNAITGVGFQPDWVWIKKRAADASHAIFDSARGVTAEGAANKAIGSNRVDVEGNGNGGLSAFGSDGFTLVDGSSGSYPRSLVNDNAAYVAWNWKANGGTATATISESGDNPAAVVQANPTAGFSIITYTGTGDAGTIAHGLGAVPKMMMIKNRDVNDAWAVYHGENTSAPETDYLVLNDDAVTADAATYWADTAPTSSVFTVHDAHSVNADGEKYVAYVFADVEGYSKFGSYTGNGNADGTFVFTGFRPRYIMTKLASDQINAANWQIYDTARHPSNVIPTYLFADSSGAESDSASTYFNLDIVSNGFKLRAGNTYGVNQLGATYIYMAFAEAPFKYANAR